MKNVSHLPHGPGLNRRRWLRRLAWASAGAVVACGALFGLLWLAVVLVPFDHSTLGTRESSSLLLDR